MWIDSPSLLPLKYFRALRFSKLFFSFLLILQPTQEFLREGQLIWSLCSGVASWLWPRLKIATTLSFSCCQWLDQWVNEFWVYMYVWRFLLEKDTAVHHTTHFFCVKKKSKRHETHQASSDNMYVVRRPFRRTSYNDNGDILTVILFRSGLFATSSSAEAPQIDWNKTTLLLHTCTSHCLATCKGCDTVALGPNGDSVQILSTTSTHIGWHFHPELFLLFSDSWEMNWPSSHRHRFRNRAQTFSGSRPGSLPLPVCLSASRSPCGFSTSRVKNNSMI